MLTEHHRRTNCSAKWFINYRCVDERAITISKLLNQFYGAGALDDRQFPRSGMWSTGERI